MNGLTDSGEAGHRFIQPEPARSLAKKSDANNMLLMIGQVYELQGELPSNRGLLFQKFVKALLKRELKTHPKRWMRSRVQCRVLSDLAFAIQREHGRGTSVPREWADKYLTGRVHVNGRDIAYNPTDLLYLARSASLLDESADGSLSFTHQLLQEHFAAVALLRLGVNDPQVHQAARYYSWDEVLVLLAGLMEDATPLVELVMEVDPFLAARCVGGARAVQPTDLLAAGLTERLGSRFRDERIAAASVSGLLGFDVFTLDLLKLLNDRYWAVRLETVRALGKIKPEAVILYLVMLLKHEDSYVRKEAIQTLGEIKSEKAISYILPLLTDKEGLVCRAAAEAMVALSAETAILYLLPLLRADPLPLGENWFLSWRAEQALVYLISEAAMPNILALLTDQHPNVRRAAAKALGETKGAVIIPQLLLLLKDNDASVRFVAREALVQLGAKSAAPDLILLLKDRHPGARETAARLLGDLEIQDATSCLIPLLKDEVSRVREASAWALERLKAESAAPHLRVLLKDKNSAVRSVAVEALGTLKDKGSIADLVLLLRDRDSAVRKKAAWALGNLRAELAIPQLLRLLRDKDLDVIRGVVEALGELKADVAIPKLLKLIKNESVCRELSPSEIFDSDRARLG